MSESSLNNHCMDVDSKMKKAKVIDGSRASARIRGAIEGTRGLPARQKHKTGPGGAPGRRRSGFAGISCVMGGGLRASGDSLRHGALSSAWTENQLLDRIASLNGDPCHQWHSGAVAFAAA